MSYDEFVASIQEAVSAHLSTGNIVFGIFLFIAIVAGIVFFALYTRKEYYRKRSEIDDFMLEERHEKEIFIPELSKKKKKKMKKPTFFEKLYKKLNPDD